MKEYWNSLLTEKSWQILQELKRKYNFILIGGWAVYLYTKQHKSKDVDIIVNINELNKLRNEGLGKNDSLRKYEIKKEEIDVDIYVEYYSKLAIPVEDVKSYARSIEGFKVAQPEVLILLKQSAFESRKNSIKGEKDKIDLVSLVFFSGVDLQKYFEIAKKYNYGAYADYLKEIVINFRDFSSMQMTPQELKRRKADFISRWRKL